MSSAPGLPAALESSHSSHQGTFLPAGVCGVLAEGFPPLCAGHQHVCPQLLPNGSPHPSLPTVAGTAQVYVAGKPWLRVSDSVPCVGPCTILEGAQKVLLGVQRATSESVPSPEQSFRFST